MALRPDLPVKRFESRDCLDLVYREMGAGRPLVLIHGFFSNAYTNWIRYGHAQLLADAGFRVIMPDLRGHGDSARPHDAAAYPPDILAEDGFALLDHMKLTDYDLGGYSLGARTCLRMALKGASPGKLILSGMGLPGVLNTKGRGSYFRRVLTNLGSFERGSSEWMTEAFLKTTKGDPEAMLLVLQTFVDTPKEAIAAIAPPTLVLTGDQDDDNGSPQDLAALIPNAIYRSAPGNHMSVIVRPQFGEEIRDFLL